MSVGITKAALHQIATDLVEVTARAGALGGLSEPKQAELRAEIIDAFEQGKFELARTKLLSLAPSARAERTVSMVVDSALTSVGIDTRVAREGWKTTLAKLGTTEPPPSDFSPRMSPVRDAFRGIRVPLDHRTPKLLRYLSIRQARIEMSVSKAIQSDDPVAALSALTKKLQPSETSDQTYMRLVTSFADLGAWPQLLEVFDGAPGEFQTYPAARRAKALALLQTGSVDDAISALEALDKDGANATTRGLLGKAYTRRYDKAVANGEADSKQWLSQAIRAYRRGNAMDRAELYPGVCLPAMLEIEGSPFSRKSAKRAAEVVTTAALSRISYGERHYWDFAAVITCGIATEDKKLVHDHLESLESIPAERWMLDSTRHHLERLLEVRTQRGDDVTLLNDALSVLASKYDQPHGVIQQEQTDEMPPLKEAELERLLDHAYRFGGRSSKRLAGNYHLDGIAHDVRVTPADVVYFMRIIYANGLNKVSDPTEVSTVIDALIREHLDTPNMESIVSAQHKFFDTVMPALAEYMGATEADSQTNVSADWINRLADCRQHAPMKLMFFEAWKRDRTRKLIAGIQRAVRNDNPAQKAELEKQMQELAAWEMRILDAEIVDAETGAHIEEHTLTLLIHREPVPLGEEMTSLDAVYLADSFYHDEHRLGGGELELGERNGALWIEVPTPSKNGQKIAFKPAPYSFDRASPSVDFGQLKFRGIQVASPGWQTAVPVEGISLDYLHQYVSESAPEAEAAAPGA